MDDATMEGFAEVLAELHELRQLVCVLCEDVRTMRNELRAIEGVSFRLSDEEKRYFGMQGRAS